MVPHRTGHDWFHRLLRPFGLHGLAVAASALSMSLSVGLPMSVPVRTVAMPDLTHEPFPTDLRIPNPQRNLRELLQGRW